MSSEICPQFDVVTDPSDHYYVTKNTIGIGPNGPGHKKVMQEWKQLQKNLPNSIYVRVYETRVDLLRAAIIGARGTPYHDGLFFFDIAFPFDYPARPPLVYYKSFGFRVNPNLYANGKVCLSLLHTWSGKKCEKWDSKVSNILQVLLSIQALVLNERPYFNEPGYGAFQGNNHCEKKALAYSENVFILSCKTMFWVLHNPPKNFEPLVKQHFMERAEFILNACEMYRKGLVKVGFFDGIIMEGKGNVSKTFKSSTDKWFRDLVKMLARNGAPIQHFVDQVRNTVSDTTEDTDVKKKKKVSIAQKVANFFLGLMTVKKKSKTSLVLDVTKNSGVQNVEIVSN